MQKVIESKIPYDEYSHSYNPSTPISGRSIKDVVNGTIERKEIIQDLIKSELKEDINVLLRATDLEDYP
mgnify:CR=1 FL=1